MDYHSPPRRSREAQHLGTFTVERTPHNSKRRQSESPPPPLNQSQTRILCNMTHSAWTDTSVALSRDIVSELVRETITNNPGIFAETFSKIASVGVLMPQNVLSEVVHAVWAPFASDAQALRV